jgi:hypothetical protein
MVQSAAGAMGFVDSQVLVLIDGVNDKRLVVAVTLVRFEAAIAKSDGVKDDDALAGAKRTKDKTLAEKARLNTTRDRLDAARAALTAFGVAVHGAPSSSVCALGAKSDEEDAIEKEEQRLLKRKLPAPKGG